VKSLLNKKGFTLIEIIVVVLLISLIAGMSVMSFSKALPSQKLEATAREMIAGFRQARSTAVTAGRWQVLFINIEGRSFGIEGSGQTRTIPDSVSVKVIDAINGEITQGGYRFVFSPVGVAEGGTVVLSSGKKSLTLDIDPVVGVVYSKGK